MRKKANSIKTKSVPEKKGIKYDNGKLQWHLLINKDTINAIEEVVKVLQFGAQRYDDHNWIHVAEEDTKNIRYFNAAMRHTAAHIKGEKTDEDSGLHPLAHKICDDLFQLAKELNEAS